jgi:carboxypeptidase family protein
MLPLWISVVLWLSGAASQPHTPPIAPPQSRISGTVVNGLDGVPIPHAEVTISLAHEQDSGQAVFSSDDGRFTFENVAPGAYSLTAVRRGFPRQAYMQHGSFSTAIVVKNGTSLENLVFRLLPDASIVGQVTDDAGDPVRGAQVMLFRRDNDDGENGITQSHARSANDQGDFHFGHLEPGTYYVAVYATPWYAPYISEGAKVQPRAQKAASSSSTTLDVAYPFTFFSGASEFSDAQAIDLKAGEKAEADVQLLPVPAVHLRLVNSGSAGPDGAHFFSAQVSKTISGNLNVTLPGVMTSLDPSTVELSGLASGSYTISFPVSSAGNVIRKSERMDVSEGAAIKLDQPFTGSHVTGVVNFEGMPAPSGFLIVSIQNDNDANDVQQMPLSPKGAFDFEHARFAAGRYQVTLRAQHSDAPSVVRALSAAGARVRGEHFDINGADDVHLTITASDVVSSVDGIALRDGKPVPGAMIVLVPRDPANNEPIFRRDQSSTDGSFSLNSVIPGKYTVIAIEDGWNLEWGNSTVLSKYLAQGTPVQAEVGRQHNLLVNVQWP